MSVVIPATADGMFPEKVVPCPPGRLVGLHELDIGFLEPVFLRCPDNAAFGAGWG